MEICKQKGDGDIQDTQLMGPKNYQIPVIQQKGPKEDGDMQAAKPH